MDERQAQLIWIAGFMDGEGCFSIQRTKHAYDQYAYHQAIVTVSQIVRKPLDEIASVFGGNVRGRTHKATGRVYFHWTAYGARARAVCLTLRPYLRVKQRHADLLLDLLTLHNKQGQWIASEVYARQQAIWTEIRQLNAGNSPRRAERLSALAPQVEGDATVRSHGNTNRERQGEIPARLKIVS